MEDQEPKAQLPSKPSFKLFGVEIYKPMEALEPKKTMSKRQRIFGALEPQILPTKYRDFLIEKGADVETLNLILTRRVPKTKMRKEQGWLSMPCNQVKEGFLNHDEEVFINGKMEERVQGSRKRKMCNMLEVGVMDPSLTIHTMKLAKWNYEPNNSCFFALTNDWNKLVRESRLVEGDPIQVWSVRIPDGQLGFVIHKMEEQAE